jgi:thiol:disulfide interchange protein DsbD
MVINKRQRINRLMLPILIAVSVAVALPDFAAADPQLPDNVVGIKTFWSQDRARPGDTIVLALALDIRKGFHINADARQVKSTDNFKPYPTNVRILEAHEGLTIETPRYPAAHTVNVKYATDTLKSFDGQIFIFLPMKLEAGAQPGSADLKIMLEYQACTDTYCLFPKKITLNETLAVVKPAAGVKDINRAIFSGAGYGLSTDSPKPVEFDLFGWTFSIDVSSAAGWLLLLTTAALGGLLLNLTPCVLPIIPIKIISLSRAARNRKRCVALGIAMFTGVIAFWLSLGILIALVSDFTATNQLFQYPLFTIVVGIIIATMALGMFGFFAVRLPNFVYMINPEQDTLKGSFGLGILAAVLATPCTAPFMGAAAAWAATQAPATTLLTFFAIGLGMALPYLVLSASPRLVEKMPKTGPASVLIKQVMGAFMLAAASYFIGAGVSAIFTTPPNPPAKYYWWPVMGFVATGGLWLVIRTIQIAATMTPKIVFTTLGIVLVGLSSLGAVHFTDKGPIDWVYYSPERLEKISRQKKVVVMMFTAEWCLNCKAIEQGVFKNPAIIKLFEEKAAVAVKVDITGSNPAGKAKLKEVGNLTIPLLVIFSPSGDQVFKSDFYTVDQVIKAVKNARQKSPESS